MALGKRQALPPKAEATRAAKAAALAASRKRKGPSGTVVGAVFVVVVALIAIFVPAVHEPILRILGRTGQQEAVQNTTWVNVQLWPNGGNNTGTASAIDVRARVGGPDALLELKALARSVFDISGSDAGIKLYSVSGQEISDTNGLFDSMEIYAVSELDHWVWHGGYIGRVLTLPHIVVPAGEPPVTITTLSLDPRIFRISHFITPTEAGELIETAKPGVFRSQVYEDDGQKGSDVRTSTQAWLYKKDHPTVNVIDERVAAIVNIPTQLGLEEAMQVVNYKNGQRYQMHYDYFDAALFPNHPDVQNGTQRLLTLFYYLTDVEEGGETCFGYVGEGAWKLGDHVDWASCERGLKVKPSVGSGVLWYNLRAEGHMDGVVDTHALHAGCSVIQGEKWGANKWIYNKKHNGVSHYKPQ